MIKFKSYKTCVFFALAGVLAIVFGYQNCGNTHSRSTKSSDRGGYDADNKKPVILSDLPSSGRTAVGGNYVMSVRASGNGILTYKWYHDDILIRGEDENFLSLEPVGPEDEGVYRVRVSLFGQGYIDSRELNLTVEEDGDTTCTDRQIIVNNACQDCPRGQRPNTNKTVCEPITCTGRQYLNGNTCRNCPTGQRPNANRTGCVNTTAPTCTDRQIIVNNACQNCPRGQRPNANVTACEPVTCTNSQILVGNTCRNCPTGQKPNSGKTACEAVTCDNPTKSNLKTTMQKQGYKNVEEDPCEPSCHFMLNRTEKTYDVRPNCTSETLVFYKSCHRKHTKATLKSAMEAKGFNRNTEDNPCAVGNRSCVIIKILGPTTEGAYYPVSGSTCTRETVTFYKHKTRRHGSGKDGFYNVLVYGCRKDSSQCNP